MNHSLSKDWTPLIKLRSCQKTQLQSSHKLKRVSSNNKRKPIFQNWMKPKYNLSTMLSKGHILCGPQTPIFLNDGNTLQIINYDFCGCQNSMIPCKIISNTFLNRTSLSQMRDFYNNELQQLKKNKMLSTYIQSSKKMLLKIIPNQFPQFFLTILSDLVQMVGLNLVGHPEFQCLMGIQYHCKHEYLTYYLYKDLKASFCNFSLFMSQLKRQLVQCYTSIQQLQYTYNKKSRAKIFQKFIQNYYNSVGANIIPLSYYSKFISQLYKNGRMFLIKFIVYFMINKQQQLIGGLKLLKAEELGKYRNFMRELHFEEFIDAVL